MIVKVWFGYQVSLSILFIPIEFHVLKIASKDMELLEWRINWGPGCNLKKNHRSIAIIIYDVYLI